MREGVSTCAGACTLLVILGVASLVAAGAPRLGFAEARDAGARNGFVLDAASVPLGEIRHGGPPRDGIPAIDDPRTVAAADARWSDDARVIGLEIGAEARAYPVAILDHHELVNDTLGGVPIVVSYCPLCGTGMVFRREVAGVVRHFGVSGLLYRSDVLLYDRESESLWSQIAARAITGPALGERLTLIRSRHDRWGSWRVRHPETTVLSAETGHRRNYRRSPYGDYAESQALYFPVDWSRRYPAKMPTLGLRDRRGRARAYPASEVEAAGGVVRDHFAGERVEIRFDAGTRLFDARIPATLEIVEGYWFAWSAFHPETTVFVAEVVDVDVVEEVGAEESPTR